MPDLRERRRQHRAAAAAEHQPERPEEFSAVRSHLIPPMRLKRTGLQLPDRPPTGRPRSMRGRLPPAGERPPREHVDPDAVPEEEWIGPLNAQRAARDPAARSLRPRRSRPPRPAAAPSASARAPDLPPLEPRREDLRHLRILQHDRVRLRRAAASALDDPRDLTGFDAAGTESRNLQPRGPASSKATSRSGASSGIAVAPTASQPRVREQCPRTPITRERFRAGFARSQRPHVRGGRCRHQRAARDAVRIGQRAPSGADRPCTTPSPAFASVMPDSSAA